MIKKKSVKRNPGKMVGNVMNPSMPTYDSQMLHRIVGQNKFDIAPYKKHGKSRTSVGRSKASVRPKAK